MTVVGMLVLPEMTAGISDASATYRPSIPCTRPSESTTASESPCHLAAPDRVVIVNGGVIEEALDRLSPRDFRARVCLPAEKPPRLRAPAQPRARARRLRRAVPGRTRRSH